MLETELFALLDRTADAAWAVTPDGEICFWNRGAAKVLGHEAAEAIGSTCHNLLDGMGDLGARVCAPGCIAPQCAPQNVEVPDFDLHVRMKSGGRLWVNVSTLVFDEPRLRRTLIVHLARDISRHKKNEEILARILEASREFAAGGEDSGNTPIAPLSEQEKRILRLFAKGTNSAGIAKELGITVPTLRNHLHGINEKLRTHNRLEAVMHAMRRGLI